MIATEAKSTRRFVGRARSGADLLALIEATFVEASTSAVALAELRASGSVEDAVILLEGGSPRHLNGPLELVSSNGMATREPGSGATLRLSVCLARETDNGIEVLGGRLLSARARDVDFVVETLDPRSAEASLSVGGSAASTEDPPAPRTWAQVVEASAIGSAAKLPSASHSQPPRPTETAPPSTGQETEVNVELAPGEFLQHPKFGLGRIERIEEGEFVSVRLDNGRLVRLSLEILTLVPAGTHEGRALYRALMPR